MSCKIGVLLSRVPEQKQGVLRIIFDQAFYDGQTSTPEVWWEEGFPGDWGSFQDYKHIVQRIDYRNWVKRNYRVERLFDLKDLWVELL